MPGNSSVTGDQTIAYTDNMCFDGTARGAPMDTNGQLWIGATASNRANNGGHVRLGSLTSPNGSITIGYSSPNITLQTTAAATDLHTARFIVSGGGASDGANYTTITAAIAAAVAATGNQTVFIQPGTYTENLTLAANVNLCAYSCDADTPNVTIVGTLTATFTGSSSLSGIRLQTNGAAVLVVSGANVTTVNLTNCYLNLTNSSGITLSSSGGSQIFLYQCNGNLATTGIHFFDVTGALSLLWIFDGVYGNTGNSTSVSTTSGGGGLLLRYVELFNAFTTSFTGGLSVDYCTIRNPANVGVIVNSTNTNIIRYSVIESGSATALTVGAGAILLADMLTIDSTNTNALDGAGEIRYGEIIYTSTSSKNNVTTKTPRTVQEVTTAISQLVYSTTNNVLAGLTTANSASLVTTSAGVPVWSSTMTNGQMIIGSTGATPVAGTITSTGGTVTVTTGAGTLNLEVAGAGLTWVDATNSTQALLAEHGYVTDRGAGVTYTLPASGTLGDVIKIVGKLGLATITPNANQQILIGSSSGAVGVTGTAVANNVGDCINLICITASASTVWRADSVIGTWTLTT